MNETLPDTPAIRALLDEFRVKRLAEGNDAVTFTNGAFIIM